MSPKSHHYLLLQEEDHILFRLDTQEMLVEGVLVEDRGGWYATVHGAAESGRDLETEQQPA